MGKKLKVALYKRAGGPRGSATKSATFFMHFLTHKSTGWFNWILHRIWNYDMLFERCNAKNRKRSNKRHINTSISGITFSWTTLYTPHSSVEYTQYGL